MQITRTTTKAKYFFLVLVGVLIVAGGVLVLPSPAQAQTPCPGPAGTICVFKTDSPDPVVVGHPIRFTIEVTPSTAGIGLVLIDITDTLPTGTTVTGVPTVTEFVNGGPVLTFNCLVSPDGSTVDCLGLDVSVNPLPIIVSFEITIDAIPSQCGTFTNTATTDVGPSDSEEFTVEGCPAPPGPAPGPAPGPPIEQQQRGGGVPITQEGEQESESGEIDQSFDVS